MIVLGIVTIAWVDYACLGELFEFVHRQSFKDEVTQWAGE